MSYSITLFTLFIIMIIILITWTLEVFDKEGCQ